MGTFSMQLEAGSRFARVLMLIVMEVPCAAAAFTICQDHEVRGRERLSHRSSPLCR